jgi:hypothetical protein
LTMRLMLSGKTAVVVSALAALTGIGVAEGLISGRWKAEEPIGVALDRLPMTVGDWVGTSTQQADELLPAVDPGTVLLRDYQNRVTGAKVTLFLNVGRPGPLVSAHTPESCYPGAGYTCAAGVRKQSISGDNDRRHEFDVAVFSKTERATPVHLRLFWAWTANGTWQVPEIPRLTFAGERRLFKIYVIRQMLREGEPLDADPIVPFIQALAPEMDKLIRATDDRHPSPRGFDS